MGAAGGGWGAPRGAVPTLAGQVVQLLLVVDVTFQPLLRRDRLLLVLACVAGDRPPPKWVSEPWGRVTRDPETGDKAQEWVTDPPKWGTETSETGDRRPQVGDRAPRQATAPGDR